MSLKSLIRLAKERKANEQQSNSSSNQTTNQSIHQSTDTQRYCHIKLSKASQITEHDWHSLYRVGSDPTCYYVKDWITADDEAQLMKEISHDQSLNQSVNQSTSQSTSQSINQWIHVRGRKLLCFGHTPGQSVESCQPIPAFIDRLMNRVNESSVIWPSINQSVNQSVNQTDESIDQSINPANGSINQSINPVALNHALINHYPRGGGIHAHKDGPAYHSRVIILSLSSTCVIRFDEKPPAAVDQSINQSMRSKPPVALLLEPRSLLVFTDKLYTDYFHSIDPITSDYINQSMTDNYKQTNIENDGPIERTDRISITLRHAINN